MYLIKLNCFSILEKHNMSSTHMIDKISNNGLYALFTRIWDRSSCLDVKFVNNTC